MERAVPKQIFALLLLMSLIFSCITRKPEYEFDSLKVKFGFYWGLEYTKRLYSHQPCPFSGLCHQYSCVICSLTLLILTLLIWLAGFDLDLLCHCGFMWAPQGCYPGLCPLMNLARLHLCWWGHQFPCLALTSGFSLHFASWNCPAFLFTGLCSLSFCLGLFICNYYSVESCSAEAKRSIYGDWVLVIPNSAT